MSLSIKIHQHYNGLSDAQHKEIIEKLNQIQMSQEAQVQQLQEALATLEKVGTEIEGLQGAVATLQEQIAALPSVSPELQAAIDAVAAKSKALDDLNPDA